MKQLAKKTLTMIWATFCAILLAPFLIPAYGLARLIGADPFSMEGMGIGFLVMVLIAGGLFIATVAFGAGYFFG